MGYYFSMFDLLSVYLYKVYTDNYKPQGPGCRIVEFFINLFLKTKMIKIGNLVCISSCFLHTDHSLKTHLR